MEPDKTAKGRKVNFRKIGVYLLVTIILMEIGGRSFISITEDVPFFQPSKLIFKYYPEVQSVLDWEGDPEKEFRILLLAGSVLHPNHGDIAANMQKELQGFGEKRKKKVVVFNMAFSAHTSLDSKWKYELLKDIKMDVVFFYHGINETRANNIPAELFRKDYSHYTVYRQIGDIMGHPEMDYLILPYLVERIISGIHRQWYGNEYMGRDLPREEWLEFGSEIKTSQSFGMNLESIANQARRENSKLIAGTFAYFIPKGYRKKAFETPSQGFTGYNPDANRPQFPIEIWGLPDNVKAGIDSHNVVVKEKGKQMRFSVIDFETVVYRRAVNYDDICHLSNSGCLIFGRELAYSIEDLFGR